MIEHEVNHYCDICGSELTDAELESNEDFQNYEFPICEACIENAIENIKYVKKQ